MAWSHLASPGAPLWQTDLACSRLHVVPVPLAVLPLVPDLRPAASPYSFVPFPEDQEHVAGDHHARDLQFGLLRYLAD